MRANCRRRRLSQRTAAHLTDGYSDPFPFARWQRRNSSATCLVAKPAPPPMRPVLHPGGVGDDAVSPLILKCAPIGCNQENYDVLENGAVVGRINSNI